MTRRPLLFKSREEFRKWLTKNHRKEYEVWLIHDKKNKAHTALKLVEAIEEALCFGWIDGALKPMDENRFQLRYSPRRRGSIWSVNNIRRVRRLAREGRMTPAGLRLAEEARSRGDWKAAIHREHLIVPADLKAALKNSGTQSVFDQLTPSRKKMYLWWITNSKKEATRRKRIVQLCEKLR
jgi:uncharacterized protein YdeI (YjbR/CyaY-like superfamily)